MIQTKAGRIHGKRVRKVLIVPCQINGIYRFNFLVDTGAAMTVISKQAADEIGIDATGLQKTIPIASLHQIDNAVIVRLDNLQVGGQAVRNVDVLVMPLPKVLRIDGLLGVNFLEAFRVTFEFDNATLILR
jgi:aspartyl protease family protein